MYVRETRIRRGEGTWDKPWKVYSYWQVVRSYRAPETGKVRKQVVAHLGRLPNREAAEVVARWEGHMCGVPKCGRPGTETTAAMRRKRRYVEKPVILCDEHQGELRSGGLKLMPLDRQWRQKYKI